MATFEDPPDLKKVEPLGVTDLGRETREGFQTTRLWARLVRYFRAKENAMEFRDWLLQHCGGDEFERKLAQALLDCGSYALFREYFTVGETRLSAICTCKKHLVCPLCAIRRGAKALRVYSAKIDALRAANARLRPFLVTLTVKNGPDLKERAKHLMGCVRLYHKRRHFVRLNSEVLKARAAVWSYETTNRGRGWHFHMHAIWLCEQTPDKYKLSEEWQRVTGDSVIVDVRQIDDDGGYLEVFKYAVKFGELEHADRLEAYKVLRGKRLLDSFGDLRGLDFEPSDSDDLLEELPYVERLFMYRRGFGYVERETGEIFRDAA